MSTNSNTSSTSNNNSSSQTQPSNSNDNVYRGVNDQGNKWTHRGDSVASGGSYHYSNQDNSYYYQNPDGSRYYNDGNGFSSYKKFFWCLGVSYVLLYIFFVIVFLSMFFLSS
ncbi:unnamed protein product [Rhizophagus irregularis]|nr:unnamed protein product [Rhizophagus irregularis]